MVPPALDKVVGLGEEEASHSATPAERSITFHTDGVMQISSRFSSFKWLARRQERKRKVDSKAGKMDEQDKEHKAHVTHFLPCSRSDSG
jgi:hypothetical protein